VLDSSDFSDEPIIIVISEISPIKTKSMFFNYHLCASVPSVVYEKPSVVEDKKCSNRS